MTMLRPVDSAMSAGNRWRSQYTPVFGRLKGRLITSTMSVTRVYHSGGLKCLILLIFQRNQHLGKVMVPRRGLGSEQKKPSKINRKANRFVPNVYHHCGAKSRLWCGPEGQHGKGVLTVQAAEEVSIRGNTEKFLQLHLKLQRTIPKLQSRRAIRWARVTFRREMAACLPWRQRVLFDSRTSSENKIMAA